MKPLHQDRTLHLIVAIAITAILGIVSVNPALPAIAKALNIAPEQIGLVIAAFVIPTTVGVPVFGMLADRVGRKKVIIPSLLVFALAGILCSTAPDFRTLLEWRFLQGIGAASLELLALTLIGDLYIGQKLIPAMAFMAGMIGISATVLPLLGGALAELNWRLVFLLPLCAVPLALFVLTALKLPSPKQQQFSLKTYVQGTWSSIKNRQVLGLLLTVVWVFILEFGPCYVYIPMLAGTVLHVRGEMIGLLLASMQIVMAVFASQLEALSRRFSELVLIKMSFLLFAIAFLITPWVTNMSQLFIPVILLGIAEALSLPPTRALLAKLSPDETRAGFMSINALAQSIGQALGPILAGIAFKLGGMNGIFYTCAGCAVVMIGLVQVLLAPQRVIRPIRSQQF